MMNAATVPALQAPDHRGWAEWLDGQSGRIMVMPAVIVLLCFAIFPLIISAYLALSRFLVGEIDKEATVKAVEDGWNELNDEIGKEEQLGLYKATIGAK